MNLANLERIDMKEGNVSEITFDKRNNILVII
jgi:hypothetical protein